MKSKAGAKPLKAKGKDVKKKLKKLPNSKPEKEEDDKIGTRHRFTGACEVVAASLMKCIKTPSFLKYPEKSSDSQQPDLMNISVLAELEDLQSNLCYSKTLMEAALEKVVEWKKPQKFHLADRLTYQWITKSAARIRNMCRHFQQARSKRGDGRKGPAWVTALEAKMKEYRADRARTNKKPAAAGHCNDEKENEADVEEPVGKKPCTSDVDKEDRTHIPTPKLFSFQES